ncbi:MAG: cupin domain-containing protein [Candidatus Dormibacter sp.]|uniref:cupin domain-containing protein n=1 Tax=Candidatus Dormibacter sp. TaxID=2973982 RepID=UPI000DB66672|nr:MAG: cupin domain-containing protein [Candidatus Dormibacteraeota bacterium]
MKHITIEQADSAAQSMGTEHFSGAATGAPLHRSDAPHAVNASLVRFERGVQNNWHRHEGGQLLHVVEGEGWVQARSAAPIRLRPGDSVSTAGAEEHWHGATAQSSMAHLAFSLGETEWLEPSPPQT